MNMQTPQLTSIRWIWQACWVKDTSSHDTYSLIPFTKFKNGRIYCLENVNVGVKHNENKWLSSKWEEWLLPGGETGIRLGKGVLWHSYTAVYFITTVFLTICMFYIFFFKNFCNKKEIFQMPLLGSLGSSVFGSLLPPSIAAGEWAGPCAPHRSQNTDRHISEHTRFHSTGSIPPRYLT